MSGVDEVFDQRKGLAERFSVAQVAFSSDGRSVGFAGPVALGAEVGGLAMVEMPSGGYLVVHVRDLRIVDREGLSIDIDVSDLVPGAASATLRPVFRSLAGTAVVIGRLDATGFTALTGTAPFGEQRWRPASGDEVAQIVDVLDGDVPTIEVGTVAGSNAPARLQAKGFSRHTFMCGQSGSGKTYTTGLLLERLLAGTTLPIVVLDPNSDHVHLGSLRQADDTSAGAQRYREIAAGVKVARARGLDAAYTLCANFSDLDLDVQAQLLRLDPIRDLAGFSAMRMLAAQLGGSYSIAEFAAAALRQPETAELATRIDNLELADWSLWRREGETSVADVDLSDARCIVLDLGSLARAEERSIVALALLGRRWARRAGRNPVLLVVDEAHNVFPASTDDALLQATANLGALIAGEGPKVRDAPLRRHPTPWQGASQRRLPVRQPGADADERHRRRRRPDDAVLARSCAARAPSAGIRSRPGTVRRPDRPRPVARPDRHPPNTRGRWRRPHDVDSPDIVPGHPRGAREHDGRSHGAATAHTSRRSSAIRAAALVLPCAVTACTAGSGDSTADLTGTTVEVVAVWQDAEAKAFERVLDRFERDTGATVSYTSTAGEDIVAVLERRLDAGDPPDVAVLPQPGLLSHFVEGGAILPIDALVGDDVRENWAPVWQRLGSVDNELYGLWFKAANKSLFWYSITAFEQAGVVPPDDLEGLISVADVLDAAGTPAFSLTGAPADAWTTTDWFENLYLRLAGTERYDALAEHRLKWTDPSVEATLRVMVALLAPRNVTVAAGPATTFTESVTAVFSRSPMAAMVMEGDFVPGVVAGRTTAEIGVDVDVFPFPGRLSSDRYVVGGGDAAALDAPVSGQRCPPALLGVPRSRCRMGRTRRVRITQRGARSDRLSGCDHQADRPLASRSRRWLPVRPF